MSDIFTKEKRSQIMAKVKALETKPEVKVRKFLFSQGFRYRKNVKTLPGTPDIVLPKFNTIVLIHGCFWHGHSCEAGKRPASNKRYWLEKIERNQARDKKNETALKEMGWNVIVIWECEIRNKTLAAEYLKNLPAKIRSNSLS